MAIRDTIETLLGRYDQALREAFLAAVDDVRNSITLRAVVERLERNDIGGAIEAMNLDPIAFEKVERILTEAFAEGGQAEVGNFPLLRDPAGARVIMRFASRDTEGEREVRRHAAQLVTRATDDMKRGIAETLATGLSEGRNPRTLATNIVGKVSRATNRREGGLIGLTSQQMRFVETARAELLSGDPERMANYLKRGRRNKMIDRAVRKAMEEGKPVTAEVADRAAGKYADGLLLYRGEVIAQNEIMGALAWGRNDAVLQQVAAGKIGAQDVTCVWSTAKDERVRGTHRSIDGKKVPLGGAFITSAGNAIRFPHDPQAATSETLGCRCLMTYRISYIDALVRRTQARERP